VRFLSTTPKSSRLATVGASASATATNDLVNPGVGLLEPGQKPIFIQRLSINDLTCLMMLSLMTSPSILKFSTKVLPFVPNVFIKKFVYPIYCGGETFPELLHTGEKLLHRGYGNMMLSYSVEDAEGSNQNSDQSIKSVIPQILGSVDKVLLKHYETSKRLYDAGKITTQPAAGYVALKPTGLMTNATDILKNYNKPEYAEKWQAYLDVCRTICRHAEQYADGKVVIVFDAEKYNLQQGVYEAQRIMMREFNRNGQIIVVGTLQMYLQDSLDQLNLEIELAKKDNYQLGMKLVRGAYLHSETDRWNVIHKTKQDTDDCYNEGISIMLNSIADGWKNSSNNGGPIDGMRPVVGRLIVASHNEKSNAIVDERIRNEAPLGVDSDESIVFGQLFGMCDDQGLELSNRNRKVIKYVPWGPTQQTKDYLVRRLQENGDAVREGGWLYFKYSLIELCTRLLSTQR
jgi:proline dehydrogenase